jgi:catechol-2,3-dioxygenase
MIKIAGIGHVALQADDPAALAAFYRDVLGLAVVGSMPADGPVGAAAFLSSRPAEEHHEIALFRDGRRAHTALKVGSLADLQEAYRDITQRGIPIARALNHGVSLSFYFADPAGHMLEVYWPTGVRTAQIYVEPVDLTLPADELLAQVRALTAAPEPAVAGAGG